MTIDPKIAAANELDRLIKSGTPEAEARTQLGFPPKPPRVADFDIGLTEQQLLVRYYQRQDGLSRQAALELAVSPEVPGAPISREQIVVAEKINVVAGMAVEKELADREDPAFKQAFDQSVVDAKQRLANQAELARQSVSLAGIDGIDQLSDIEVIEAAGYTPVTIPTLEPVDVTGHPDYLANAREVARLEGGDDA